jgi:hypothetical protein
MLNARLRRCTRFSLRHLSVAAAALFGILVDAASAWAQAPGAPEAPAGRGYTMQYLLVVLLAAMAVGAVCKSSMRHAKDEE